MRNRSSPAHQRTFGRFLRHIIRRNPWHDRPECERIAQIQYGYIVAEADQRRWARWVKISNRLRGRRCIARDTLVIAFIPGRRWPDGEVSNDQWTAAVIHRNQHVAGRTTYINGRTRAEALRMFEEHHRE
jgi:hypothetical protein